MKTTIVSLALVTLFFIACNNNQATNVSNTADSLAPSVDRPNDWKFGIALWTFHTVDFPQSLDKVDSAGLKYIEPNTFHKAGPELKDSVIGQLSMAGIEKIKSMIAKKGLICESLYIVGDSTMKSWIKQFDIAKQLGVKYVTTEPPLNMHNLLSVFHPGSLANKAVYVPVHCDNADSGCSLKKPVHQ